MKLIIGNKNYSSWSLRGWLACKQSGLAFEEIATNVIKYGYDDDLEHEILAEAILSPGALVLRVRDDGHEFDPLRAPPPDLDAAIEDRPIGGLGIHLLRKLAERLSYERVGGHNVLTLWFERKPKS